MMRFFTVSLVVVLGLLAGAGAPAFAAGIPDTIRWIDGPDRPPYWISEELFRAALDSKNEPPGSRLTSVLHLFPGADPSHELDMYASSRKHYKLSPEGTLPECEPLSTTSYFNEKAKDVGRLFELASSIAHVRILESKTGFAGGRAGELLEVEVISILKDEGEDGIPHGGFYLFNQYARMVIDGKPLCLGDRAILNGEYFLFLPSMFVGIVEFDVFTLDSAALVSGDGTSYGSLLDHGVDRWKVADQLAAVLADREAKR